MIPAIRQISAIAMLLHLPILAAGIMSLRLNFFLPALCRRPGEPNRFALTFDDGPDPELTPAVLALLDEFGFKATFFLIGQRVRHYPDLAKAIAERGHTIASHDLNHFWHANFRRQRRMAKDISEANSIIAQATGRAPRLYRPPVGLSNPHLRIVLEKEGMICIGWDRAVHDGGNRFFHTFKKIPSTAHAGSIVMLHDCLPVPGNREPFLKELRNLFERAQKNGLISTGVDTLFGIDAYHHLENPSGH
jgi:peptidoglycan/xylan/chitin deacetylase (PgdA/CDA1 family)